MLCIYDIIVHVAVVARMTYEYPITLTEFDCSHIPITGTYINREPPIE